MADLPRLLGRYLALAAGLVLLNFFIPRLLPGDPLSFSSGQGIDVAAPLPAATRARLADYYHLDEALPRQLVMYLHDLGNGDLGRSIARPAAVSDLIAARLSWTLGLLAFAFALAAAGGGAAGLVMGWAAGTPRERIAVSLAAALASIPEFLVAIGLLLCFAVGLDWFPLHGGKTVFAEYGDGTRGAIRHAVDVVQHLALPATALVLTNASAFFLIARDTAAGLRREPWLVAVRAKGLDERAIVRAHALPNLVFPLLNFAGLRLGGILGGALIVERVFGVPGIGLLGFEAIQSRDYPVLQALFLVTGLGVLAANFLVDLIQFRLLARQGRRNG